MSDNLKKEFEQIVSRVISDNSSGKDRSRLLKILSEREDLKEKYNSYKWILSEIENMEDSSFISLIKENIQHDIKVQNFIYKLELPFLNSTREADPEPPISKLKYIPAIFSIAATVIIFLSGFLYFSKGPNYILSLLNPHDNIKFSPECEYSRTSAGSIIVASINGTCRFEWKPHFAEIRITMDSNSKLEIIHAKKNTVINFKNGWVLFDIDRISTDENYFIHTGDGLIRILGTIFTIGEVGKQSRIIEVVEGSIEIENGGIYGAGQEVFTLSIQTIHNVQSMAPELMMSERIILTSGEYSSLPVMTADKKQLIHSLVHGAMDQTGNELRPIVLNINKLEGLIEKKNYKPTSIIVQDRLKKNKLSTDRIEILTEVIHNHSITSEKGESISIQNGEPI